MLGAVDPIKWCAALRCWCALPFSRLVPHARAAKEFINALGNRKRWCLQKLEIKAVKLISAQGGKLRSLGLGREIASEREFFFLFTVRMFVFHKVKLP